MTVGGGGGWTVCLWAHRKVRQGPLLPPLPPGEQLGPLRSNMLGWGAVIIKLRAKALGAGQGSRPIKAHGPSRHPHTVCTKRVRLFQWLRTKSLADPLISMLLALEGSKEVVGPQWRDMSWA